MQTATTGNFGKSVRSDCQVTLEMTESGGIKLDVQSKLKSLYGNQIKELCLEVLTFFDIKRCNLTVEDKGALPLVMAARLEAAIKQLIDTDKEYLLDFLPENQYPVVREKFRFSRLYLPGNTPKMMLNAGLHNPDGIILDLEDSVAYAKKDEARLMVRNALRGIDFYGAERMVRINQFPAGIEDLKYIIPNNVHVILVPKCESAKQLQSLETEIDKLRKAHTIEKPVLLMPIIESAMGVEKAFEIASATENVIALAIGLEDYTADLGARRTQEGLESFYARTRLVNACRAAGIQAIDSVYSDVGNPEGLKENVKISKGLGFEGMGCIHPRQIAIIHESFAPETAEIEKAKKIVIAFTEAEKKGLGVVSVGTKMVDPPVVKRALKTIDLAVKLNKLPQNWIDEEQAS